MAKSIDEWLETLDSGNAEMGATSRETWRLVKAFNRIVSNEGRAEVIRLVEAKADEDEASRRP